MKYLREAQAPGNKIQNVWNKADTYMNEWTKAKVLTLSNEEILSVREALKLVIKSMLPIDKISGGSCFVLAQNVCCQKMFLDTLVLCCTFIENDRRSQKMDIGLNEIKENYKTVCKLNARDKRRKAVHLHFEEIHSQGCHFVIVSFPKFVNLLVDAHDYLHYQELHDDAKQQVLAEYGSERKVIEMVPVKFFEQIHGHNPTQWPEHLDDFVNNMLTDLYAIEDIC
ncbi:hypothetical protein RFI_31848 [Reticulomyxa filosa]|uniref:Uncharacterized protein n=1 Tax=Reticulomyxa filosa TaxID=46433 RepID=X6LUE9_RETFI|nr:hypothetical protein RFI_31848 [Reticulomyxa filosa]|eukprot:ETO05548.1 hypothetical protein RFI_31848 [Reticulomyxa filosa]